MDCIVPFAVIGPVYVFMDDDSAGVLQDLFCLFIGVPLIGYLGKFQWRNAVYLFGVENIEEHRNGTLVFLVPAFFLVCGRIWWLDAGLFL